MAKSVLLLDSSKVIQKVIQIALENSEFKLETLEDIESTLTELKSIHSKYSTLLIDGNYFNQQNFLLEFSNSEFAGKTIVLVGSNSNVSEEQLHSHGLNYILRKPFDPKTLLHLLGSVSGIEPAIEEQGTQEPVVEKTLASVRDSERKGKKAFVDIKPEVLTHSAQEYQKNSSIMDDFARVGAVAGELPPEIIKAIEQYLPKYVQQAVRQYCQEHFDELARSVVETELRRLAMERARHLVDN